MTSLSRQFFDEVRAVHLGEKECVNFDSEKLISIASDVALSNEFCEIYHSQTQDKKLRALILDILARLAQSEEIASEEYQRHIVTIDTYIGKPATVAAGAGVAAILIGPVALGTAPLLGAAFLVGGGGLGMLTALSGRTILGKRTSSAKTRQSDVDRLISRLKEQV